LDKDEMPPIVEDMQIMSQILDKALGRMSAGRLTRHVTKAFDDVLAQAKRNPVFPAGPYDQTRGVFLEGYGALFLTEVDYPLTPGRDKSSEPEQGKVEESVWEETMRELGYTRKPELVVDKTWSGDTDVNFLADTSTSGTWGSSSGLTIRYDAKRVEQLQKTLLETLKHATNIRSLKPEDSVAVVVQGTHRTTPTVAAYDASSGAVFGKSGGRTMLTIRVKKSDIDAFASGELPFDEWRKKATMVAY